MTAFSSTAAATSGAAASSPLLKGRHRPDFSQPFALSVDDERILSARGLDQTRQDSVEALYTAGRSAVRSGQARSFLAGLDTASLALLQSAASLADPIDVGALSEEGAENLLLAPTEGVDLNGDGLLQTGAALLFSFRPVNASPALRAAWEEATASMSEGDILMLSMQVGGILIPVDGGNPRARDVSDGFDWNRHMADLISANEAARAYNTPERTRQVEANLRTLWDSLRRHGLA
ncbi:hypothetical protein [Rhodoplanes sp. SY1]|uniref:hypothetical protein n=1 Tax=Rhodoplanes sp. SY1 TaxID=3166646 RepID=UPI0038B61A73